MRFNNIKNYILSFLAVVFVATLMVTVAFAADDEYTISVDYLNDTTFANEYEKFETMGVLVPAVTDKNGNVVQEEYRKANFENDEYAIRANDETGEVGILVKKTGQILLTNPYDVPTVGASDAVKAQLMSQIILQYTDNSGTLATFTSYNDAALNGTDENNQIDVKPTRTGIRVEYTIGKEQARYVVPRQISKESFENNILGTWSGDTTGKDYRQVVGYYALKDPNASNISNKELNSMKIKFPITAKGKAIYVLDPGVSARELEMLEGYLADNTTYNEDKMVDDYAEIEYVDNSAAPALFRFAIEYSLDEYGVQIKMPSNSIKYDTSNYSLKNVKLLPYFSAGNNENKGFTLLPDGSGTIIRFEDVKNKSFTFSGKLYGKDYSFHTVTGYTQEAMRIPAFGSLETVPYVNPDDAESAQEPSQNAQTITKGFVAYFDEGDALCEFSSDHGGTVHKYSSVYATFYPQVDDTYALTGISASGDAQWTVSGNTKYIGNYTMRLFPIYGEDVNYVDMANAVREYLVSTGVLKEMTPEEDSSEDVPLYIENFGTIKTDDKILGFPVKVQTPLTTFEQTKEMIEELQNAGAKNLNIKLTGWYNGGMEHTAPTKLTVPGSIGGMKGLKDLVSFANEKNVTIFPDLDFAYVGKFASFDGFSMDKHVAKTLDGRNAAHRVYNALYQGFEMDEKAVISPMVINDMYENISEKFEKIGSGAVSLATMGSELNSDHNKDYPIGRDQSRNLITQFLENVGEKNSIMVDGGNAYTLKYADHILGVPLDSSMNINTSESVPFMGMVLHGCTEFAGTAINLDGDYEYSVLKAIENGANLYFMVSKDNTSSLKLFPEFNKFYAVRYDNWKDDIISTYTRFNEVMKDVKYSSISEHEYLGTRIVKVGYSNGTQFVLNYNTHDVVLDDGTTVEAMNFAVSKAVAE